MLHTPVLRVFRAAAAKTFFAAATHSHAIAFGMPSYTGMLLPKNRVDVFDENPNSVFPAGCGV
jgi:hypothetical protein